jgi:Holliday junction resolvase RusA-like endonuclease
MRFLGWGVIWARGFQMSEIKLVIYGEPVPQGRPKFARIGNHVHAYDPQKSKNYKQLVRYWVTQQLKKIEGLKPLENALYVDITFWLSIPSSWSKKKRIEADSGVIRPIKRPDADNLFKSLDALNGLLWVDDSIITDLHIRKRYTAEMARVEITVREVE